MSGSIKSTWTRRNRSVVGWPISLTGLVGGLRTVMTYFEIKRKKIKLVHRKFLDSNVHNGWKSTAGMD